MPNLAKMNDTALRQYLADEAKKYGVLVEDCACGGVELRTPEGKQFDTELHGLVSSPWDGQNYRHCLFAALKDLKENGPRVRNCPENCPCKETE